MFKKLAIAIVVLFVLTYALYTWISSLPRASFRSDAQIEVSARTGEAIFWGRGTCHVCHRIGERGYALRGPNLGAGKEGPAIHQRASARARHLGLPGGTAYLVQSIAEPAVFIVPGFNNEMPEVFKGPIALSPPEIKSLVLYLQSLGGDTTATDIRLPAKLFAAYAAPGREREILAAGDAAAGRPLFFDAAGPAACAKCHIGVDESGARVGSPLGPDLTAVGSIRTPLHLFRKIVRPDSNIVSGYGEVLVKTRNGRLLTGLVAEEDDHILVLTDRLDNRTTVRVQDIQARIPQNVSLMPSNYRELLSEQQLRDLVAYLVTLTGAASPSR